MFLLFFIPRGFLLIVYNFLIDWQLNHLALQGPTEIKKNQCSRASNIRSYSSSIQIRMWLFLVFPSLCQIFSWQTISTFSSSSDGNLAPLVHIRLFAINKNYESERNGIDNASVCASKSAQRHVRVKATDMLWKIDEDTVFSHCSM